MTDLVWSYPLHDERTEGGPQIHRQYSLLGEHPRQPDSDVCQRSGDQALGDPVDINRFRPQIILISMSK